MNKSPKVKPKAEFCGCEQIVRDESLIEPKTRRSRKQNKATTSIVFEPQDLYLQNAIQMSEFDEFKRKVALERESSRLKHQMALAAVDQKTASMKQVYESQIALLKADN